MKFVSRPSSARSRTVAAIAFGLLIGAFMGGVVVAGAGANGWLVGVGSLIGGVAGIRFVMWLAARP
jgi:hypothetical protein